MKKKVCIISSTRADLGLLLPLVPKIKEKNIKVTFLLTGTHFLKSFGETYKEVQNIKGTFVKKLIVKSAADEEGSLIKFKNNISSKLNYFLKQNKQDLILVLGDRFEILECCFVAYLLRIPIAHIHGGEITYGSYDDSMRHSITKLSNYHFVSHKDYKTRIAQLGEDPKNIFCVGSLGVSAIKKERLIKKKNLKKKLGIEFNKKNLVVVYHPVKSINQNPDIELNEIFKAIKEIKDTSFFFTYPGLESGFLRYKKMLKQFVKKNKNCFLFKSLGHKNFMSLVNCTDGLIGNSSSGIIEVATLKKAFINIGNRQLGRKQSKNTINCAPEKKKIIQSINKIYSPSFIEQLKICKNIYDLGDAPTIIANYISKINLSAIPIKKFKDLKF